MNRIRIFAVTALAAVTLGAGGLAAPESASAQPRDSCERLIALFHHYWLQHDVLRAIGNQTLSWEYLDKARGLEQAIFLLRC